MAEEKTMRLSLVAKQINVGTSTILQFLSAQGHKIDNNPNAKLNFEQLTLLAKEYGANHILQASVEAPKPAPAPEPIAAAPAPAPEPKPEPVVEKPAPVAEKPAPVKVEEAPVEEAPVEEKSTGLKVLGKIELDKKGNPVAPKAEKAPEPAPVAAAPEPKPEPVAEKPAPVNEEPKPVVVVETPAVVEEIDIQLSVSSRKRKSLPLPFKREDKLDLVIKKISIKNQFLVLNQRLKGNCQKKIFKSKSRRPWLACKVRLISKVSELISVGRSEKVVRKLRRLD